MCFLCRVQRGDVMTFLLWGCRGWWVSAGRWRVGIGGGCGRWHVGWLLQFWKGVGWGQRSVARLWHFFLHRDIWWTQRGLQSDAATDTWTFYFYFLYECSVSCRFSKQLFESELQEVDDIVLSYAPMTNTWTYKLTCEAFTSFVICPLSMFRCFVFAQFWIWMSYICSCVYV